MVTALIRKLVRPLKVSEETILNTRSIVGPRLLKSIFLCFVLRRESLGLFMRIFLRRLLCVQTLETTEFQFQLLYLETFCFLVARDSSSLVAILCLFFWLYMQEGNTTEMMEVFTRESAWWFVFRFLNVSDQLAISFYCVAVLIALAWGNQRKSAFDAILVATVILMFTYANVPSYFSPVRLFPILVMSSAWMVLKYQ